MTYDFRIGQLTAVVNHCQLAIFCDLQNDSNIKFVVSISDLRIWLYSFFLLELR